jgi:tetratricopeptide (TPR) repeat protein
MSEEDLERARVLMEVGRWQEARPILAQEVARQPDSARCACLMAHCHLLAGARGRMLDEAERACALAPHSAWAHRLRSIALRAHLRLWEAVAAARESVRLAPELWQSYVELAEALLAAELPGYRAGAEEAVNQALRLAPSEPDVRITAGRVYTVLGDVRAARRHYQQVLAGNPDHDMARNNLATLDLRRGRVAGAAAEFAAALGSSPTQRLFLRNLQAAATMWLLWLQVGTSGLFVACLTLGAAPLAPRVRVPLAALVALATCVAVGYAYRRLPAGARRLVLRPELDADLENPVRVGSGLRVIAAMAAIQVLAACVALASGDSPLGAPLWLAAACALIPALVHLVRVGKRELGRIGAYLAYRRHARRVPAATEPES